MIIHECVHEELQSGRLRRPGVERRVGFTRVGATLFHSGYSPVSDFEFDFQEPQFLQLKLGVGVSDRKARRPECTTCRTQQVSP